MKTKYYVNDEKKVVVCKLEGCSRSLICDMCHKNYPPHPALEINDVFVGKAKLHPDDAFDLEKGQKIALRRAMAKLSKAKARALTDFMDVQNAALRDLNASADKLIRRYNYNINRADGDVQYIVNTPVTAEEN